MNPLTAAVMAEVATDIGFARLLTYDLAEMLAEPGAPKGGGDEAVFVASSMMVHQVCSLADRCVNRAMELMNSAGYAREGQIERYWRDLKTVQCYLGAG